MKRTHLLLALAALAASSSTFAEDIDIQPYGYVSAVMREAKVEQQRSAAQAVRTRAQVRAETLEAARLGLVSVGEAGAKEPTPEQARQIEQAGLRALAFEAASK